MEVLERDVAGSIPGVLFSFADKRYTLRNVRDDRWLNFDGLA
jgi:hypothetical protein